MQVKKIKVAEITPYWRNPRDNSKAIDVVADSIQKYGFNQPLVLDKENVIVVGHTRFAAIQKLGWKDVPCVIMDADDKAIKKYRLMDNKAGEYAKWDTDKLMAEIMDIGTTDDILDFFPNINKDIEQMFDETLNKDMDDIEEAAEEIEELVTDTMSRHSDRVQKTICPHCGKEFEFSGEMSKREIKTK